MKSEDGMACVCFRRQGYERERISQLVVPTPNRAAQDCCWFEAGGLRIASILCVVAQ